MTLMTDDRMDVVCDLDLSVPVSEQYRCDVCDKLFRSRESLSKHNLRRHTCADQECESCKNTKPPPSAVHGRKKTVSRQDSAKPTRAKPSFPCPNCSQIFKGKATLSNHINKKHSKSQNGKENLRDKYGCDECSATFATAFNLKRHKSLHLPTKSFRCSVCDKAFFHIHYLRIHQNTHSTVRRFYCADCDSVFKTKYGLTKHKKTARLQRQACELEDEYDSDA